ncbi:MAG: Spy/CpxP family protein refolding chaperone [Gemmatimonadales bacterium]|jgi:TolA-binding protein
MRKGTRRIRLRSGRRRIWLSGLTGLALVAILAAPAEAQQQGKRQRGMDPEARMERLKASLELTDDQVAALEPIFAAHDQKRRELSEKLSAERQAMREQMEALRLEMDEELAEVLTEEQMQSFLEHREEMRQRFKDGRRGGRGKPPPSEG